MSGLVSVNSLCPRTKPSVNRYGVCPEADDASRASAPSSGAARSASAVATPWPLKRRPPSCCVPPSNVTSPPITRALAPATAKPFWLKLMRALAAASSGVSRVRRTSLPARTTLPCTLLRSSSAIGSSSASFNSAAPLAVVSRKALLVQPPTGELLTKRSKSAAGPRASPSNFSTGLRNSRMLALTFDSSRPHKRACTLRTSSVLRSISSSPATRENAGHDAGSPSAPGT